MNALDGVSAVVTGGASGIGAAIVARLRRDGATVAVFDRVVPGEGSTDFFEVDVTDNGSVISAVDRFARRAGGVDIVVNSAGVGARGTVESNSDDEWHAVFDVNVLGIVRVCRATLPWLRHSRYPAIVNVASIAATAGLPERALYGASKGAVLALTRHMAADYVHTGIRVNAVSPGTADTPWVERLLAAADDPEAEREALAARQPHGRLVTAAEIADAVAYLAHPSSGSTTGIELAVDGGMAALRLRQH